MVGLDPTTQTLQHITMPQGYDYILASMRNGTLCIGLTNSMSARIYAHRCGRVSAFTKKYDVKMLVCYETDDMVANTILRETTFKH